MTRHCKAFLNQRVYIYDFLIAPTRAVLRGSYFLVHAQCRAHCDDNENDNSHEHMSRIYLHFSLQQGGLITAICA